MLTSGGRNTAIEGILNLKRLVAIADEKITIIPGSGVNAENIKELKEKCGAEEFHLSGKTFIDSQMKYRKPEVSMGGFSEIDEYKLVLSDIELIRKTINAFNSKIHK